MYLIKCELGTALVDAQCDEAARELFHKKYPGMFIDSCRYVTDVNRNLVPRLLELKGWRDDPSKTDPRFSIIKSVLDRDDTLRDTTEPDEREHIAMKIWQALGR